MVEGTPKWFDAPVRQDRTGEASSVNDKQFLLSDSTRHSSKADADAYIEANYSDDPEHGFNISVDKLIASGTAATLGLAGIYLVARHRRRKE